jgi:hypothetical protein
MRSSLDVLPTVVASLKDLAVGEVPSHFSLVPSLANDHEAVRGSIVVKEDQVFVSCPHSLPQTRVALRGWAVEGVRLHLLGPITPAPSINGIRPFIQLGEPCRVASRAPHRVGVQGFAQVRKDLVHVCVDPELPTTVDHRAEIGPSQVSGIGHHDVPFSVLTRWIRLPEGMTAAAVLQVVSECLFEVQFLGNLGVIA